MRVVAALSLCAVLSACPSAKPNVTTVTCSGADQTACGTVCAKVATDDAHCGSCGKACASGEACAASSCFPKDCPSANCDPNSVCYMNSCIDKSCVGVICPAGQVCSAGACVCGQDRLTCSGACIDPKTDPANCGACGHACGSGQSCANGACYDQNCPGEVCDPSSICYMNACTAKDCVGVLCPGGQQCSQGQCGCYGSSSVCDGGVCADTRLDSQNCGACGHSCAADEKCAASTCFPKDCPSLPCGPLEVCSNGTCVEASCVSVQCPAGQVCSAGTCVCATGQTACGASCVDTQTNPNNCGACGHACNTGEACAGGVCGANPCMANQSYCSGTCVDLNTSPDNCGACGAACGGGRNCVNKQCACPQGLVLCGTQCTNLATDPANCGSCGNTCNGGTCGTGTPGVCSCPTGKSPCNGSCADLSNDPHNCGMCGLNCADGGACAGTVCTCPTGQKACNGQCIDVSGDNLNCGGCNVVCGSGKYCAQGSCQNPFTCQSNYNPQAVAGCSYFPLVTTNCGAETLVNATHVTGTVAGGANVVTALTTAPGERVAFFGTIGPSSGSGNWEVAERNNMTSYIGSQSAFTGVVTQPNLNLSVGGSPWACAQGVDYRISASGSTAMNYDFTVSRYARERFNTGAPGFNFADAGGFAMDGGVVCDQLCGDTRRVCGDDRQSMAAWIPPGKAIDFQIRMWVPSGGANEDVQLLAPTGAFICNLVSNVIINSTPADWQARVVNNTPDWQQVLISPYDWGTGNDVNWSIAATTEP